MAAVLAGAVAAQDWTGLSGADLAAAFRSRTLQHETGAIQDFHASGETTLDDGGVRTGRWWIDADRLCLRWQDAPQQSCLRVRRSANGLDLGLTDGDGATTVLRYIDLN